MTYITHGNYKGARWFPRCCCEDCEVIKDPFVKFSPIDASRWEVIRGNWSAWADPQATADSRAPLHGTHAGTTPILVVGKQQLPDDSPDFYTVTDVTLYRTSDPIFVVDYTDSVDDQFHAVQVTYDDDADDKLIVKFYDYDGTTRTQLGSDHVLSWTPAATPGDWLRATFTVCLNGTKLMLQMAGATTGDAEDGTGKDAPPDFMFSEDITAKKGGKRAGIGHGGGSTSATNKTRWNSFELHIHENQQTGCPSCLSCACSGPPVDEYDVTIASIIDVADGCCDNCADLNGTYTLQYSSADSTSTVCVWKYVGSYTPLWNCNTPSGSPCEGYALDVDEIWLTVKKVGSDCVWKLSFVDQYSAVYFGSQWKYTTSHPCTCELSSVAFPYNGVAATATSHDVGEVVLDSDGQEQARNNDVFLNRWFSEVCDITSATVTLSAS